VRTDVASDCFVGRDEELGVLRGLVAEVKAGVGGTVLVEGEQGIGKTALLRTGLAEAEAGCRTVWGAADELGQQFPLALMSEILGPEGRLAAVGEEAGWGRGGRAQAGRGAAQNPVSFIPSGDPMLAGVERLLTLVDRWCAVEPVVLVAEDLQWADEASVLVWHQLRRAARQLPLLVAGSMRSAPDREDLGALRRGVLARGGGVISLRPLSSREVATLVGRVVGGRPGRQLVAAASRAGGNPFYAREVAEALVRQGLVYLVGGVAELAAGEGNAGVPESLAGVIGRRLSALSEDVLGVLRWAAVLGQEFSATNLQAVTGRDAGELIRVVGQAAAAGVVVEVGRRLGFRHGLIRQVLYEGMPASLRAALHLRAAQALDGAGAAAEQIAAQLVAAVPENSGKWVRDWLAGAAPDLAYRAPQAATELLRAALAELPVKDPQRNPLEAALVQAAFLLEDDAEVESAGRRLLARNLSPDRAAQVAWLFSYSLMRTGRPADAAEVVGEALSRPGIGDAETLRLQALQAMIPVALGRIDDAARIAEEVLASAERIGEVFAAGYALFALARVSLFRRDWPAMLAHVDRALGMIGDDPETTDLRLLLLMSRFAVLAEMDRQQAASATAQGALALAERSGTSRVEHIRSFLGGLYFTAGRWDDALAELETATGPPGRGGGPPQLVHGLSALIAGHRDDTVGAARHLEAVADIPIRQAAFNNSVGDLLLARVVSRASGTHPRG
jgi:tetratricopeptide (TPR) repeat protein